MFIYRFPLAGNPFWALETPRSPVFIHHGKLSSAEMTILRYIACEIQWLFVSNWIHLLHVHPTPKTLNVTMKCRANQVKLSWLNIFYYSLGELPKESLINIILRTAVMCHCNRWSPMSQVQEPISFYPGHGKTLCRETFPPHPNPIHPPPVRTALPVLSLCFVLSANVT